MPKIEIEADELTNLKIASKELDKIKVSYEALEAKNIELWENFKNAKLEAKTKNDKKLLEVVTEKETIENELKVFKDALNIWEVEDLKSHLENLNSDITKYWEIKEQEEIKIKQEITNYTDFLNKKHKDYLTWKVEIFWEEILNNPKALKDFATAQWFEATLDNKNIKVWELKNTWKNIKNQDWFDSAFQSWDIEAMKDSFADNLLK